MSEQNVKYEGWTILEVMGHRRIGGYVREQEIAGYGFLRIDVPGAENEPEIVATQFYPPSSIYCLTPTTEEIARAVATNNRPTPVHRWELPQPQLPSATENYGDDDDEGMPI